MVIVKEEMVDVGLHSIENGSGTVRFCSIWFDLVRTLTQIFVFDSFRLPNQIEPTRGSISYVGLY